MRTTWGQLKQFILKEMKLGIAGAEYDANAWGNDDDELLRTFAPEDESDPEPSGPAYAPGEPDSFDPGETVKSWYRKHRHRPKHDMAGDPMDV